MEHYASFLRSTCNIYNFVKLDDQFNLNAIIWGQNQLQPKRIEAELKDGIIMQCITNDYDMKDWNWLNPQRSIQGTDVDVI